MPNLPAHIHLAAAAAERLERRADVESHLGYFLLGSTAPDIRALTKRARAEYHFVELDFENVGDGVSNMFAAYPDLMNAAESDAPTRAFVAGYISHLLADETYITRMFRPYFGEGGVFEDGEQAQVWDRALQLDFDRQAWDEARTLLLAAAADMDADNVRVRFLPREDLQRWKEWVYRVVEGGFSWDRLRFMARRIAAGDERAAAHLHAERFISSQGTSLNALYDLVPKASVDEFRAECIETMARGLGGYLS